MLCARQAGRFSSRDRVEKNSPCLVPKPCLFARGTDSFLNRTTFSPLRLRNRGHVGAVGSVKHARNGGLAAHIRWDAPQQWTNTGGAEDDVLPVPAQGVYYP